MYYDTNSKNGKESMIQLLINHTRNNMSIEIAEKIDKYVVRDGMDIYKERYENMTREKLQRKKMSESAKEDYELYWSLSSEEKKIFFQAIENVTIDITGQTLKWLDDAYYLDKKNGVKTKMIIDGIDMGGKLYDSYIAHLQKERMNV